MHTVAGDVIPNNLLNFSLLLPHCANRQHFPFVSLHVCRNVNFRICFHCIIVVHLLTCVAEIPMCSLRPLFEGGGLGGGVGVCDRKKRKTHQGRHRRTTSDLLLRESVAVFFLFLPFRRKTPSPTSLVSRSPMTSAPATGRWSATGSSGCWEKPSTASALSALRWWPLTQ